MICDRDPRWTLDFWRQVAKTLKSKMMLSSSHHPQHDGQTEIVNKFLEMMLRAYISKNKEDWVKWIPLLEFAYNSALHSSTGFTPFRLLLGFDPRSPLDFMPIKVSDPSQNDWVDNPEQFLQDLNMHRDSARRALAKAQHEQAK